MKKITKKEESLININIFTQSGEPVEHDCKTVDEAFAFASENAYQVSIN